MKKSDAITINGIECVLVEAGTFTMGSPISEKRRWNDETQHQVTLTQDCWISKYPVTNAQYGKTIYGKEHCPVVNVTWTQANAWSNKKGGRLPTEAEWEFAANGGNKSKGYIYSGSDDLDKVGWYCGNSNGGVKPVGQKDPNELGIYDMSGNVLEWCNDLYEDYAASAVTNPTGAIAGSIRVLRGGSWNRDANDCRVALRNGDGPLYSGNACGFRIVFPHT